MPHENISIGNTMETLSNKGKLQNNIYIFKIDKIDNALASLVKINWHGEGENTNQQY